MATGVGVAVIGAVMARILFNHIAAMGAALDTLSPDSCELIRLAIQPLGIP